MPYLRGEPHGWRAVWVVGWKSHDSIKETPITAMI